VRPEIFSELSQNMTTIPRSCLETPREQGLGPTSKIPQKRLLSAIFVDLLGVLYNPAADRGWKYCRVYKETTRGHKSVSTRWML